MSAFGIIFMRRKTVRFYMDVILMRRTTVRLYMDVILMRRTTVRLYSRFARQRLPDALSYNYIINLF